MTTRTWPSETDPELYGQLILATLQGLMAEWHLRPGSFSWEEMAGVLAGPGWRSRRNRMRQQRVDSWWAQWTWVGGTCAPPVGAPGHGFGRALDSYTSMTAPFLRGCYVFVAVAAAWAASSALGLVGGLLVAAAFFLVAGTYCLANFARCREAHCILTGLGWSALAIAGVVALLAERDIRGGVWIAFLGIALAGHGFEAVWKAGHGSNALRLGAESRVTARCGHAQPSRISW